MITSHSFTDGSASRMLAAHICLPPCSAHSLSCVNKTVHFSPSGLYFRLDQNRNQVHLKQHYILAEPNMNVPGSHTTPHKRRHNFFEFRLSPRLGLFTTISQITRHQRASSRLRQRLRNAYISSLFVCGVSLLSPFHFNLYNLSAGLRHK